MQETNQNVRGLTRRWRGRPTAMREGCSFLDRVLSSRGLAGSEASRTFLNPSLGQLRDPGILPDIDRAAERLLEACARRQTIAVYGDYDVDGITSTMVLYRMLKAIAPDSRVLTYVPHRLEEGYGLNSEALASLAAEGARVVVTVDCGITAVAEARAARELGLDLIITDHHNPPAEPRACPDVLAIVHPGLPWAPTPFSGLCGAGVAFKLAWRLATMHSGSERVHDDIRKLLLDLLGPVALGVVADVVPMIDENRVLTRFGLGRVPNSPFVGLRALVTASGLDGDTIDTERVGFQLGPRLNACGRMGHAREAVELMITEDWDRAHEIARQLATLNDQRRRTERAILEKACTLAEEHRMTTDDRRAIVLAHPEWHPGVVGIVCSRLVDRFARPTILMQQQAEMCTGSGRSIDGFNLHGAIESCSQHLIGFGGHDMAAGLRVASNKLQAFVEAFLTCANEHLEPEDLIHTIDYDCAAEVGELRLDTVEELERLAPFGRDNPPVRLRLHNARLNGTPKTFGANNRHLSLDLVAHDSCAARGMRAVGWGWSEHAERIPPGAAVEAIVTPKISRWNGYTRVEAELADLMVLS